MLVLFKVVIVFHFKFTLNILYVFVKERFYEGKLCIHNPKQRAVSLAG